MRTPNARPAARAPKAPVPRMMQAASSYVGRRVLKCFKSGWFRGAVVATRDGGPRHGTLFVTYYSDGDHEDLSWKELAAVLVPPKKPKGSSRRAPRAAAAARAPRAKPAAAPRPPSAPAPAPKATHPAPQPLPGPKRAAPGSSCVGVKRMVTGGFQARVPGHLGPHRLLGNYASEVDAGCAVDRALRSLGVPEQSLNFPRVCTAEDAAKPVSERGAVMVHLPATAPRPVEDEAAFVLALQPPLSASAAVLDTLRSNGVTMRHLRALGAVLAHPGVSAAAKQRTCAAALADCGVHAPQDRATLCAALQRAGRLLR